MGWTFNLNAEVTSVLQKYTKSPSKKSARVRHASPLFSPHKNPGTCKKFRSVAALADSTNSDCPGHPSRKPRHPIAPSAERSRDSELSQVEGEKIMVQHPAKSRREGSFSCGIGALALALCLTGSAYAQQEQQGQQQ